MARRLHVTPARGGGGPLEAPSLDSPPRGGKRRSCYLFLLGGAGKAVGLPLSPLGFLTPQGQGNMAIVKLGSGRIGLGRGESRGP